MSICPLMSCRTTKADKDMKTMTPTVVNCISDCALYDHEHKGCSIHSIMVELKKGE